MSTQKREADNKIRNGIERFKVVVSDIASGWTGKQSARSYCTWLISIQLFLTCLDTLTMF